MLMFFETQVGKVTQTSEQIHAYINNLRIIYNTLYNIQQNTTFPITTELCALSKNELLTVKHTQAEY